MPLYYLLQFITREHDDIHIDAHYISLKSGKSYHILCWNTHPFRTDDIVLKLSDDLIGSPIFINTLSLKDYDGYLEKMKRINMALPPEKAQDIKDCAALAGLSITQYLLMCHENYQHGKMNNN